MIRAEIAADSISPQGKRIETYKLRYPKFIHSEFMTHRLISRNASSSRAIPVAKLIAEVRDDAQRAGPVWWGREQKGMASGEILEKREIYIANELWKSSALHAASTAAAMVECGVHKSIVNRLLEPFSHINVVATATEWDNFFGLRLDKAAQPEMRALAVAMWEARQASEPVYKNPADWHLPFADDAATWDDIEAAGVIESMIDDALIKVSVARCARVSYQSFETGKRSTVEEDLQLYHRLVGAQPLHASPAEHQATPDNSYTGGEAGSPWQRPDEHGNFIGWRQYRKMLPGEECAPLPKEFVK